MNYTITTRKKLSRNKYGDVTVNTTNVLASGGSSGGGSGGGTVYNVFTAATSEAAGVSGLVPAPQIGSQLTNSYLLNAKGQFVSFEFLEKLANDTNAVRPVSDGTINIGTSSYLFNTAYIKRWQPTSNSSKYIEYDSTNGAFKVNGDIYATGNVAAGGFSNTSGSGTGGGSDVTILTASSLSTSASAFSSTNTSSTFNAYTINYLHRRLNTIEAGNINVNLDNYVTKTQLSNQSYITSTQLSNQSYITSTQLSNQSYVTTTQLSNQSYVTSSALNTRLNNASYVSKSELSAQSYLVKTGDTMTGNLTMGANTKLIFNSSPASYIKYDSTNGALMVYGNIYATGQVAAGGYSGNSGSGSSSGDLSNYVTKSELSGCSYAKQSWVNEYFIDTQEFEDLDRRVYDLEHNGGSSSGGGSTETIVTANTASGTTNATTYTTGNEAYLNIVSGSSVNSWAKLKGGTGITIQARGGTTYISATGSSSGGGSVSISNGSAETGKYISALSASGSTITVTKDDLPSGGGEWYNIKTAKIKNSSTNEYELFTMIENFAGSTMESNMQTVGSYRYVQPTKYRLVLMTFKKERNGRSRAWRVPMFSRYWDWSSNNSNITKTHPPGNNTPAPVYSWGNTWWTIEGTKNKYFQNRAKSLAPKWYNVISTATSKINTAKHAWKGLRNRKKRFGCAIFKYTGEGTFGWHRVSNISYVELFVTNNNKILLSVKE